MHSRKSSGVFFPSRAEIYRYFSNIIYAEDIASIFESCSIRNSHTPEKLCLHGEDRAKT